MKTDVPIVLVSYGRCRRRGLLCLQVGRCWYEDGIKVESVVNHRDEDCCVGCSCSCVAWAADSYILGSLCLPLSLFQMAKQRNVYLCYFLLTIVGTAGRDGSQVPTYSTVGSLRDGCRQAITMTGDGKASYRNVHANRAHPFRFVFTNPQKRKEKGREGVLHNTREAYNVVSVTKMPNALLTLLLLLLLHWPRTNAIMINISYHQLAQYTADMVSRLFVRAYEHDRHAVQRCKWHGNVGKLGDSKG